MKARKACLLLCCALLSTRAFAQSAPLDHSEVLGRLAVGYSPSYIAHLVKTRGVTFTSSEDFLSRIKLAGGDGILVKRLFTADAQTLSLTEAEPPFDHLAKCAELIHTGALESAEKECRASIEENTHSPWPLLATAELLVRRSSEQRDLEATKAVQEASTELLRAAAALAPNLAAVHQSLGSLGNPEAAAEMQKAHSLDTEQLEIAEREDFSAYQGVLFFDPNEGLPDPVPSSAEPAVINPDLQRRIQLDPDLARNHILLALQYSVVRNFDAEEREYQEAVRLEPDNPEIHSCLALFYRSRHNPEAFLAELRESVRSAPAGSEQRMTLAGALELLGRTAEAVAELQDLLAIRPAAIEPSNALVELFVQHKDPQSAIAELRRSLKASSVTFTDEAKFVDARFYGLNRLAYLLLEGREFDAAAEQFLFLLRYKADNAGVHNDYGNVLLAQRHLDQAISEFNQALRLDPSMSHAHHNIGICLALKKNVDGAITEFQQALELNPEEPNSRIFLGTALGQKGDLNGAMDQFQQALEKDPKDPNAHMSLAYAYMQLNDTAKAIHELKLVLELQPGSPMAENDLAWIYATAEDLQFRNPAEALALARRAVKDSPQPNAAFLDTLAEALLLNGQPTEALATEEQAASLEPQNPEIQSRLPRFRESAQQAAARKP
jgi:tetratricopeptide (TPR) repeat protein